MWVDRTIIVPAASVAGARAACAGLAGASGSGMFTVGLSASGAGAPTHYVSSGKVQDDFAALLPLTTLTPVEGGAPTAATVPGDADTAHAQAVAAGLPFTKAQIAGLLGAVQVFDAPLDVALTHLGIQVIR